MTAPPRARARAAGLSASLRGAVALCTGPGLLPDIRALRVPPRRGHSGGRPFRPESMTGLMSRAAIALRTESTRETAPSLA
ncbi:hypothetical protein PS9374_06367 [Planomonospora sphaerica]|uniref:Uncharacterized protein n=1 Tax=Planomonospora sphaerica TaxID=161355 RepID=A0A171DNP2_9ACTN|nr:hypothetical protein PS9374_06367 [Planomonospora sphaerica]